MGRHQNSLSVSEFHEPSAGGLDGTYRVSYYRLDKLPRDFGVEPTLMYPTSSTFVKGLT